MLHYSWQPQDTPAFQFGRKKTFSCTQCESSCTRVSYLKKHMLTHSGEKPFRCDQCNYSCARACVLKSHKLTHTAEQPFVCKQCSFSSSSPSEVFLIVQHHIISLWSPLQPLPHLQEQNLHWPPLPTPYWPTPPPWSPPCQLPHPPPHQWPPPT